MGVSASQKSDHTWPLAVYSKLLCSSSSAFSKIEPGPQPRNAVHWQIEDAFMQDYDLIVIGSGPGGQRAAIQAAKCGKRVVLIEKQSSIGGTSVNLGTIPSKTLREAVLHLSGFRYQNLYGVDYRVKQSITMDDLIFRVKHVIETEISVTQSQLQ